MLMNGIQILIVLWGLLFWSFDAFALETLNDQELRGTYAQNGLLMQMDNVNLEYHNEGIGLETIDNHDKFGDPIGKGKLTFKDISLMTNVSGLMSMDVGTYPDMNEEYVVVDLYQLDVLGHKFDDMNVPNDPDLIPDIDPWKGRYWRKLTLNPRPKTVGMFLQFDHFDDNQVEFSSDLEFSQEMDDGSSVELALGNLNMSGMRMPEFPDPTKPESIMTIFPHNGISMELRTRLSIDKVEYKSDSTNSSCQLNGIHFRESFPDDLPDCYPELKNAGWDVHVRNSDGSLQAAPETIDTSNWATYYPTADEIANDKPKHMYSGYFLFGNMNQVAFYDSVDNGQDKRNLLKLDLFSDDLQFKLCGEADGVKVVEAPMTLDVSADSKGPFVAMNLPMHGSIRIENTTGLNGANMGPVAVDGLRVKMLSIRFPGNGTGQAKKFIH